MDVRGRKQRLSEIYAAFEERAAGWKREAVCRAGCAFCCTHFGSVDVTTLEALAIRDWVMALPVDARESVCERMDANRRAKLRGEADACPFLAEDHTCRIYSIRPFSCRQLYSVRPCGSTGPTVHRGARELVNAAIRELQQLDDTGYSGHLSLVLALLESPGFLELYVSGGFRPQDVADIGRKYRLVINRVMTRSAVAP